MPRRPRIILPDVPLHIIQRGNNRQPCFAAEEDYRYFLDQLEEIAPKAGVQVHAYVLMTNHVHLLLTGERSDSAGQFMKALGQRYVSYFNRAYNRSGTLWEGRFRSCLVQQETYLMTCMRYIELNPVRAGMVERPADYPWTSYRINAQGEKSTLVKPHRLYEMLGPDSESRCQAYRELFRYQLEPGLVDTIRQTTNGNVVLGDSQFSGRIGEMLGRRVIRGQAGRPKAKDSKEDSI